MVLNPRTKLGRILPRPTKGVAYQRGVFPPSGLKGVEKGTGGCVEFFSSKKVMFLFAYMLIFLIFLDFFYFSRFSGLFADLHWFLLHVYTRS